MTLAEAARIMREADYRTESGLGPTVTAYLRQKRIEQNFAPESERSRETTLRALALFYADLAMPDFDGTEGTPLLRTLIADQWGDASAGTRRVRISGLRDYFQWAEDEGLIDKSPARALKVPKRPGTRRKPHPRDELQKLVGKQPRENERLALELTARAALRRSELRRIQLGDFNLPHLTIYGKGSKEATVKLPRDLAAKLERYLQDRAVVNSDGWRHEYLLFFHKIGQRGSWPLQRLDVIAENRLRPLSYSGVAMWWKRCVERAGLPAFPMHELRHSAGTDFYRRTRDYELTRQFLRHQHISTTATYIHEPSTQLEQSIDTEESWTK